MRIAQVAPLYESVPPKLYGGTERVVFNLTEALVAAGHEVTLFASGDSLTSGRLIPVCREALRLAKVRDGLPPHLLMFERLREMATEFDILHFHNEYLHFPMARTLSVPVISTLHGRLDLPEYGDLFMEFRETPLVSISMNQRRPLPYQNWAGVVHHGMNGEALKFSPKGGEYLAFLGRITADKGIEEAISIAKATGHVLKIAAKVDPADAEYYKTIRHLIEQPGIEFIGEIGDRDKSAFLGGAKALLFPINWPEPFGLVMIESIATGTPVIAFRHGSVPEVIRDGVTGFIVENVKQACAAVQRLGVLKRIDCRRDFEARFTIERMAEDYLQIYKEIIANHRTVRDTRQPLDDESESEAPHFHRQLAEEAPFDEHQ